MEYDVCRGDVFYIEKGSSYGSEQQAGRPAIVVSNNWNNKHSSVVEVVYLTTAPKTQLPTHCVINSTGVSSVALCEQVHSVCKERIQGYRATITDDEMKELDECLAISLGLDKVDAKMDKAEPVVEVKPEEEKKPEVPVVKTEEVVSEELISLRAENRLLKEQYERLLMRLLPTV